MTDECSQSYKKVLSYSFVHIHLWDFTEKTGRQKIVKPMAASISEM
jgi:hypothetical protein